jgi:hypothetical protein
MIGLIPGTVLQRLEELSMRRVKSLSLLSLETRERDP